MEAEHADRLRWMVIVGLIIATWLGAMLVGTYKMIHPYEPPVHRVASSNAQADREEAAYQEEMRRSVQRAAAMRRGMWPMGIPSAADPNDPALHYRGTVSSPYDPLPQPTVPSSVTDSLRDPERPITPAPVDTGERAPMETGDAVR